MAATAVSPDFAIQRKPLDVNKYATKKTIAQGMLDIALLTANASQLKYILQVGSKHEFYTLMLSLIITSIILQVAIGVLLLSLNLMRDCKLHLDEYKTSATYINYITTSLSVAISAINLLISAFDPSLAHFASSIDHTTIDVMPKFELLHQIENITLVDEVVVAGLSIVLVQLEVHRDNQQVLSAILNHFLLGLSLLAMVSDVVKMSFGLDPAISLQDHDRYGNITK